MVERNSYRNSAEASTRAGFLRARFDAIWIEPASLYRRLSSLRMLRKVLIRRSADWTVYGTFRCAWNCRVGCGYQFIELSKIMNKGNSTILPAKLQTFAQFEFFGGKS
jgi:hypothetical protein